MGKGDVVLNKQTFGGNNGNFSPLLSRGEFKITASQGVSEVFRDDGYSYNVTVQAPNYVGPNRSIFYQISVIAGPLIGGQADSSFIFGINRAYNSQFDFLGWVNCE